MKSLVTGMFFLLGSISPLWAEDGPAEKEFYNLSKVVSEYASKPIDPKLISKARSSAESLIQKASKFKKNWNYGNALHHGNLVLGRIKLMEGDTASAKRYLELASKTPGSPQLDSFGPNMTLAKELLQKGEKEAVLKYFDDCLKFWDGANSRTDVASWKAAVLKGEIPNFGANLDY